MMTVREALNLPALSSANVIAGKEGLERRITWFHIVDIPQIVPWITEGDLVLSCAYACHLVPEITEGLISKLYKSGASALIIAEGIYLAEIPCHMIEEAEKYAFPLIVFAAENKFRDVTLQLSEKLLRNETQVLKEQEVLLKEIMKILTQSNYLVNVINVFKHALNIDIMILDGYGRIIINSQQRGNPDDLLKYFRDNEIVKSEGTNGEQFRGTYEKPYVYYRFHAENREFFILILDNIDNIRLDKKIMIQNMILILGALVLNKEIFEKSLMNAQLPLLEKIILGRYTSSNIVELKAKEYGWDLKKEHVVIIFYIHNFEKYIVQKRLNEKDIGVVKERIEKELTGKIQRIQGIYPIISEDMLFTTIFVINRISFEKKMMDECTEIIKDFEQVHGIELYIGISTHTKEVASFASRYMEAKETIQIIKTTKMSKISKYDQVALNITINKFLADSDIKQIYLAKILELAEYDLKYKSDLINTLRIFINNKGSVSKTSRELNVHRNTINYRLQKIEDIIKISFNSSEMFLTMSILLKTYDLYIEQKMN